MSTRSSASSPAGIPAPARRGPIARLATALALASLLLLFGAQAAFAGVGGATVPSLQSPVVVSTTAHYTGNIVITNANTGREGGDTNAVSNIVFTPSCGALSDPCTANDPGVFSLDPGSGTGAGACAGLTFAFGPPDPVTGAVTVTPSGPLLIPSGAACTINFTFMTTALPTPNPSGPGTTEQVVTANFRDTASNAPGFGSGTGIVTVTDALPTCALTGMIAGPPKQLQITAQETDSGIKSIVVTTAVNTTVSVPSFTPGTTAPVVVTATKIDQAANARVALTVTDVGGRVTMCDPVLATVGSHGATRTVNVDGVAQSERYISVVNGAPGLRRLTVLVNGRRVQDVGLRDGQHLVLDIGHWLAPGDRNTVTLRGRGERMATADVLISDSL